jgi:hypothetical protein
MSLTWQGYVVLALVAGAILSSVANGRREDAEAHRLAALGPCGLAASYVEWSLSFERVLGDAPTIQGESLKTFVNENALYLKAAGLAKQAQDTEVLRRLEAVVRHDSDSRNDAVADVRPFYQSFFDGCPKHAEAIVARSR